MMMMPVPLTGLNLSLCRSSIAGMRKASVFPEPVRAAPRTSLPVRRTGIDFSCTAVMCVIPISSKPLLVASDRSRSANGRRPKVEDEAVVDFAGDWAVDADGSLLGVEVEASFSVDEAAAGAGSDVDSPSFCSGEVFSSVTGGAGASLFFLLLCLSFFGFRDASVLGMTAGRGER